MRRLGGPTLRSAVRRGRRVRVLTCVAALASSTAAHAETRTSPAIALRYAASAGCPTAEAFRDLVRRRSTRAELADDAPRAVDVRIDTVPPPIHARIVLPAEDGGEDTRVIQGSTCASVTDAAALLVALYLDALSEPASAPSPPPEKITPPPSPPMRVKRSRIALPLRQERQPPWQVSAELGVHVALASGLAPTASYGEWLFVGATARTESRSWRWLSPSLRLGVSTMRSARFDRNAYGQLRGVEASFCPVRLPLSSFGLRPCAVGILGGYSVSASSTTRSGAAERSWRSVGIGILGEWRPAFAEAVAIELALDGQTPLVRDRFFRGTEPIHETPRLMLSASIGLAVRWP